MRPTAEWISMSVTTLFVASFLGCNAEPTVDNGEPASPPTAAPETAAEAVTTDEPAPLPVLKEPPKLLSAEELADGWISLFDGQTLFGWQPQTDANWRVENGAIVVDDGEPGLLCTTADFGDYVLRMEFRSAKGANSGVFLHTPHIPEDVAKDCYELNIADSDNPYPTASLVSRIKAEGDFESEDWQAYEVTMKGGEVAVQLDAEAVLAYTDPQPIRRGPIGLQLNHGRVEFRNIRLKPLGLNRIFNGKDLAGWKTVPDSPSKFAVTEEGWLNVKNGRGQLETEGSYGDFVLQLECITHAPELNSGIFFRCVPGSAMDGYESQIQNAVKEGDRTQPVDCGTGGIFRRSDARLVVADDEQWFSKTIVATGPHVAVWVNGAQVCDWTDDRDADDNPRNGLRTAPGSIMIQGHDPTTDLSFRNLRITELAPRTVAK